MFLSYWEMVAPYSVLTLTFALGFLIPDFLEHNGYQITKRGFTTSLLVFLLILFGTVQTFHGWLPTQLSDMNGAVRNLYAGWLPLLAYSMAIMYSLTKRKFSLSFMQGSIAILILLLLFVLGAQLIPHVIFRIGNASVVPFEVGFEGLLIPLFVTAVVLLERHKVLTNVISIGCTLLLVIALMLSTSHTVRSSLEASGIPLLVNILLSVGAVSIQTMLYRTALHVFKRDPITATSLQTLPLWIGCLVLSCLALLVLAVISTIMLLRLNGG